MRQDSLLVVSGAFSYNGQNQTKAIMGTPRGRSLYDEIGFTGVYSTYTANETLQDELSRVTKVFDNFLYLPCTPDGYLKGYDDPFLDKSYLWSIPEKYNAKACAFGSEQKHIREPVLKGRRSSGSKQVYFGVENWKAFDSINDIVVQERKYGVECLFDVVNNPFEFTFTGRENIQIQNGRDKIIRFLKEDSREVTLFKELLSVLRKTFDLPRFFNVQCIVDEEGIHVLEIDSRFSGTVACTTAYIPLLRKAWVTNNWVKGKEFNFIEGKLDLYNQDSNWKLEVEE